MREADLGGKRKPRLAIMGEFSAGKSTLTNLLLGARPIPEQVTATRLAPVWISRGTDDPYRVKTDGSTEAVNIDRLAETPLDDTRYIKLFFEAEILELCDLIDFPGISDPNMDAEVWERVISEADIVLWCTHATQAWRQSEAAVWETVPDSIKEHSLLLVTRFDKLQSDRNRRRVMLRLSHETEGLFSGIYPMSLLQAVSAKDDAVAWEDSGASVFFDELVTQLSAVSAKLDQAKAGTATEESRIAEKEAKLSQITPRRVPTSETSGPRRRPRPA